MRHFIPLIYGAARTGSRNPLYGAAMGIRGKSAAILPGHAPWRPPYMASLSALLARSRRISRGEPYSIDRANLAGPAQTTAQMSYRLAFHGYRSLDGLSMGQLAASDCHKNVTHHC
jgi:hypothetical protein